MPIWLQRYIWIAIGLHLLSGLNRPPEYLLLNIPASLILFGVPLLLALAVGWLVRRIRLLPHRKDVIDADAQRSSNDG
jgi:hypothetical protein